MDERELAWCERFEARLRELGVRIVNRTYPALPVGAEPSNVSYELSIDETGRTGMSYGIQFSVMEKRPDSAERLAEEAAERLRKMLENGGVPPGVP